VLDRDLHGLHEALLAPKYNFGAPNIAVSRLDNDGSLELEHDHVTDGRGIDVDRARKVLEYIRRVWRRPVTLHTVDQGGASMALSAL
jgi:stage V sporulation protein R